MRLKINLRYTKNKVRLIVSVIMLSLISFIDGTDDRQSIELYLKKLQTLSIHKIDEIQKKSVTDYYVNQKNRNPNQNARHKIRKEFNLHKNILKQQWCVYYSIKWPTEKIKISETNHENLKNPSEKIKNFEAHHIIPINSGGINRLWNITPLSSANHHELHTSIEEHACFSHNAVEQKTCRLILRAEIFGEKIFRYLKNSHIQDLPAIAR